MGNTSGTVTGTITGLNDNATGAATSVTIDSVPVGLGGSFDIGNDAVLWDNVVVNSFTVTNGVITAANFEASTTGNNDILCLNGVSLCVSINALTLDNSVTITGNSDGFSGVIFTPIPDAVPFEFSPGLGILILMGLWGTKTAYSKYKSDRQFKETDFAFNSTEEKEAVEIG